MSDQKKLEELQAYQARLQADVRRSRMIDEGGLTRNSPLVKNLQRVNNEINELQKAK